MDRRKPIAVVDTNIMLSLMTCVDLALHSEEPGWSAHSARSRADRVKARQATILSWHLHELKAATYTLWEAIRMTVTKVNAKEGGDPLTHFTVIWVHCVRERLLPDWMIGDPSSEGPGLTLTAGAMAAEVEKLWEGEPTGHAADQLYVNKAKEFGIPLITFEGFRQDGTIDPRAGIRVKAKAAGVTAMTPAEFYAGRDEHQTCTLFLNAFRDQANAFVHESSNPDPLARAVERVEAVYRYVLFGEAGSERLPITF